MQWTKTMTCSFIGLFAALIAVCAQIIIPMPLGVPFTLQTFAVALAGVLLGRRRGALAALVYVLIGAIGAPVFSGFGSGIGVIFGPGGGFLLSFPVMAWICGVQFNALKQNTSLIIGLILGNTLNLSCGMLVYLFVMKCDFQTAFLACFLTFIPGSLLKCFGVFIVGTKLRARIALFRRQQKV